MFNTTDDTRIKKQSLRRSTLTSQSFFVVIENDEAVAGVASWTPQVVGLVAAESGGKAVAWSEEINRAGLAEVLGKDSTIFSLRGSKPRPGLRGCGHDLFPAELISVVLGKGGPHMTVLGAGGLQRGLVHVDDEALDRQ